MPTIIIGCKASTLDYVREALSGATSEEGALILDTLRELAERTFIRTPTSLVREVLHERMEWCQEWDEDSDTTSVDYHHCPTYIQV